MNNDLSNLLMRNRIDEQVFNRVIYDYFILSIFEDLYYYLLNKTNKHEIIIQLRNTEDKCNVIKNKILEISSITLNDLEVKRLTDICVASINKKEYRRIITKEEKELLLNRQDNKCILCHKKIDISNSHYDHIVPWIWVGDELADNYQMLCTNCNLKKSKSILYGIKTFFKNTIIANDREKFQYS